MPKTTNIEETKRVRGDLLRSLRVTHPNPALRTQQGLGSHSVYGADERGISTRTVARAEDGVASFETVERLAHTLGANPWDLWIPLSDEHVMPSSSSGAAAVASGGDASALVGALGMDARGETVHQKLDTIIDLLEHRR